MTEKTKIELNEIRNRVINGEKFEKLAKEYSEDPGSAKQGGEFGVAWKRSSCSRI